MWKLLVEFAVVAMVVPAALADDLNPPPWERTTTPDTTYQYWDSWYDWYAPEQEYLTDDEFNPYGTPLIVDPLCYSYVLDEYEGRPDVLHVSGGDLLQVMLPNTDTPNPRKEIFFQWVWHWDGAPLFPEVHGLFESSELEVLESYAFDEGDGWWYEWFKITIYPSVDFERIDIWPLDASSDLYIDQIVIDTICIPEPVTSGLLAIGGLGLVRRKRGTGANTC